MNNLREKLIQIISHFGLKNQTKKLAEETYELQEAIFEAKGYPVDPICKEHIAEEIADVCVLLNQIIEYFALDGCHIDELIDKKVDRTIDRIKEGYYDR